MTPPRRGRRAVIGVGFGTLSGQAVVVSADDGTTLGSAVHGYAHGVLTETLPGSGRRLPHDWDVRNAVPAEYAERAAAQGMDLHEYPTDPAARLEVRTHGPAALDWLSGNRSVLVDHELFGLVVGLTLSHRVRDPEDHRVVRGQRRASHRAGGRGRTAEEPRPHVGLRDVTRRPLSLLADEKRPALGSAFHAAAAGACKEVHAAYAAMAQADRGVRTQRTALPPHTTRSTPGTPGCTTTSAAVRTT